MESESGQSDVINIDPTKRIVKYFSKCLIELIKHAESIQYKKNKLVNYDVSTTLNYDSNNEMDITEHHIKSELQKDGPIFKEIDKIKQSIVELLAICSHQNIIIDYDTSKAHVAIYDAFDDSQRILVMNHLTLHILSLVENIYLALKYFKSLKYAENGPLIRKTFSNIYKELKTLSTRSDIIENMDSSFKSLTPKSEYTDSYNYLVEKLSVLFKYICKFNKSYSKKCDYTDLPSTEYGTDDDHTPKKKRDIIKREVDINTTKTDAFTFKVPTIENANSLQNIQKQSDDTKKKKKQKLDANKESEDKNGETEFDAESVLNSLLNDTENESDINSDDAKKKKKRKLDTNKENENKNDETEINAESLLNSLLSDTINECNNSEIKKKNKKSKKKKSEDKIINTLLEEQPNELVSNSLENSKPIHSNGNTNKETIDPNEKTSETKEKINEETNGKVNEETNKKENEEANKKRPKKQKLNNKNKEGNNKKRKQTETNKPNEKIKKRPKLKQQLTEDDLTNSILTHDINEAMDENDDSISVDLLSAISDGEVEIDYDKKDMEDFTKIIHENELNDHERFLYIQDLLEEANAKVAISEETKEKIRNLKVLIDWEVPPAHLIVSSLSAGPNEEERALLAQIPITNGPFNSKEDAIIKNNWKDFIEKHDVDDDPAPFLVSKVDHKKIIQYEERIKFLQYMGRGLPHKSLYSILRRFKCLFRPEGKIGRFSPEEDELILTYLNNIKRGDNTQKFVRLAPLIKRDRLQIERRYRVLREATKGETKKVSWTLPLKEKFLKHLLEETQSTSVEDLRDVTIDAEICHLLSKFMNIHWKKLRLHWNFRMHTELFSLEPINSDKIKIKLIKKFRELGCDDWKTIDWSQMTAMFRGITKCYLWISLKNAINEYVPVEQQKNLKDSIDYLHEHSLPMFEERYAEGKSRILPRLRYEDGTLSYYK